MPQAWKANNCESLPNSAGREPPSEFWESLRSVSDAKSPSSEGMEPDSTLPHKLRVVNCESFPKSRGMEKLNELLDKSSFLSLSSDVVARPALQ